MAKVVVITSGKGGVGKTTTAAAFAAGLALRGHKTVVIDFDVGLRNLDLVMGCERRVVFDFINVINGDAKLNQALINDKRIDNLYIFPTSQTRDKDALEARGGRAGDGRAESAVRLHHLRQPGRHRAWRAHRALFCRQRNHRDQPRGLVGARQRPDHRHPRVANRAAPSATSRRSSEHLLLTRYDPGGSAGARC